MNESEKVFYGGIREMLEALTTVHKGGTGIHTDEVKLNFTTVVGMNIKEDLFAIEIMNGKDKGWLYTDTAIFMFKSGDEFILITSRELQDLVKKTHAKKETSEKAELHKLSKTPKGIVFGFLSEMELKDNAIMVL
jgi:hypothetical protein